MENEIAVLAAGYVGLRLGIVVICAYSLYKVATFRKPIELRVGSNENIQQSPQRAGNMQ